MKYNHYDIEDFLTDPDFIDAVRTGQRDKKDFLQDWLRTNPENKHAALTAREILLHLKREKLDPTQEEFDASLHKILSHRTAREKKHAIGLSSQSGKRIWAWDIWKWAASVIVIAGLVFLYKSEQKAPPAKQIARITKTNPYGQKSQIRLPDGSTVKLNAGSEITYLSNFAEDRKVNLEGEAFFDVIKDTRHPFRVEAGKIEVAVLGTSFDVKAFADEPTEEVVVVSGKVMAYNTSQNQSTFQAMLSPNEMISFKKSTGDYLKTQSGKFQIAWTDGTLHFENAGFEKVAKELERWYGYTFVFPQNDEQQFPGKINGTFTDKSLEEILEGLKFSVDIRYRIDKVHKQIIINKK